MEALLKEEEQCFYLLLTLFNLYPVSYLVHWFMKTNSIQQVVRRIEKLFLINKTGSLHFSFVFLEILRIAHIVSLTEWKNGY